MNIVFKKVLLHNFGSYQHAEIILQNKGFCKVSGQNKCKKDNAASNGAGKSFIWSAICFALTGSTIQGLRTNLRNINSSDESSYVELVFQVDRDTYEVTRHIAPKSDLTIIKNGDDLSGKGIKESAKKLEELLPNLTKELIASTIIIGQGMPHKFSSFSPSGRKELLEKLTKSDFMLSDVKDRVEARRTTLMAQLRSYEDQKLVLATNYDSLVAELQRLQAEQEYLMKVNYDAELFALTEAQVELQTAEKTILEKIGQTTAAYEGANAQLVEKLSEKAKLQEAELTSYTEAYNAANSQVLGVQAELQGVDKEITRLKAVTDICPTCKQKLPGKVKPDTSALETRRVELTETLANSRQRLNAVNETHNKYVGELEATWQKQTSELQHQVATYKQQNAEYARQLATISKKLADQSALISRKTNERDTLQQRLADIAARLDQLNQTLQENLQKSKDTDAKIVDVSARLSIIAKMDSLIRRDFRGFLLTNIIDYLDKKAKDYSEVVFNTRELSIYLNNNDLDIAYSGKLLDSLSGGERTRVDLILQLAIRDLMYNYFGYTSNILVLDEVTDFLDAQACEAIFSLMNTMLVGIESVFIVSHHSEELKLPIDTELKVIKNENGVSAVLST